MSYMYVCFMNQRVYIRVHVALQQGLVIWQIHASFLYAGCIESMTKGLNFRHFNSQIPSTKAYNEVHMNKHCCPCGLLS